jgi:hypothetical protein
MSNPARYNFLLVRGDDFTDVWTIKDSSGNLVDLSTAAARMVINSAEDGSGTDLLTADSSNNTIALTANGTWTFNVPAASTAALDFTTAYYDAQLTLLGKIETILYGEVTLKKDIA